MLAQLCSTSCPHPRQEWLSSVRVKCNRQHGSTNPHMALILLVQPHVIPSDSRGHFPKVHHHDVDSRLHVVSCTTLTQENNPIPVTGRGTKSNESRQNTRVCPATSTSSPNLKAYCKRNLRPCHHPKEAVSSKGTNQSTKTTQLRGLEETTPQLQRNQGKPNAKNIVQSPETTRLSRRRLLALN